MTLSATQVLNNRPVVPKRFHLSACSFTGKTYPNFPKWDIRNLINCRVESQIKRTLIVIGVGYE